MKHRFPFACVLALVVTAFPAGADAPPGRYMVGSGTVYDARTQLTWQQTPLASSYNFANATMQCALLGGAWRLPTRAELLTLVDPTLYNPAIDPVAFPSTPTTLFWTSSARAGLTNYVWAVDFISGYSFANDVSVTYRVRCVY